MPQHTERSHYKDLGRLSVPLCFYSFLSPLTALDIPWLSLYVPFPFKYISQASHLFALQRARIIVNTCNIQLSNAVLYSGFTRPVGLLSRWCVCWQGKEKKTKTKKWKVSAPSCSRREYDKEFWWMYQFVPRTSTFYVFNHSLYSHLFSCLHAPRRITSLKHKQSNWKAIHYHPPVVKFMTCSKVMHTGVELEEQLVGTCGRRIQ